MPRTRRTAAAVRCVALLVGSQQAHDVVSRGFAAGAVEQDAAHHGCRESEELKAMTPSDVLDVDQAEEDLVYQFGALQAAAVAFVA